MSPAATHAAMQTPKPALQLITIAGTPAPAVTVPKTKPPACKKSQKKNWKN